jgi:hypothetical protein
LLREGINAGLLGEKLGREDTNQQEIAKFYLVLTARQMLRGSRVKRRGKERKK